MAEATIYTKAGIDSVLLVKADLVAGKVPESQLPDTATSVQLSTIDAKGDLLGGTAANALDRIAVGADGVPLIGSAAAAAGWAAGQVATAGIADAAVTTAKILDANVTAAKLAAAIPLGIVGRAEKITNQASIGAVTDITGLSVTWTAVAGRVYRTTASIRIDPDATDAFVDLYIRNAAGTNLGLVSQWVLGGKVLAATWSAVIAPAAGLQTHKVSAGKSGGTMQQTGTVAPCFILVEDIGGV